MKTLPRFIDFFGILLLLLIGIRGQFHIFNPSSALSAEIPLLSTQHLPGSQLVTRLVMPQNRQPGTHEYFLKMKIDKNEQYIKDVMVFQTAIWYADTTQPADEWNNQRQRKFGLVEPISVNSLTPDRPQSVLYCPSRFDYPSSNLYELHCYYLAFWGHWYTQVDIYSRGGEFLSDSEIQRITEHVDRLLLSAPDVP